MKNVGYNRTNHRLIKIIACIDWRKEIYISVIKLTERDKINTITEGFVEPLRDYQISMEFPVTEESRINYFKSIYLFHNIEMSKSKLIRLNLTQ